MRIWWVAKTGNDLTGDGSFENPFLTIDHVVPIFTDGDQIRIQDGTYNTDDSIVITGLSGSIFAENFGGVTIQPQKTTLSKACIEIKESDRFSIYGINVEQATDPTSNSMGIYMNSVRNCLLYACNITNFTVLQDLAFGIFAVGHLGRVESCNVSNITCDYDGMYGIRTGNLDVINCHVTALSGDPTLTTCYTISVENYLGQGIIQNGSFEVEGSTLGTAQFWNIIDDADLMGFGAGVTRGRVIPTNFNPSDGSWAFVLGDDQGGIIPVASGQIFEIYQDVYFNGQGELKLKLKIIKR